MQKVQQERSNFYHVVETTANDFVMKGKDWLGNLETARSSLLQAATVTAALEEPRDWHIPRMVLRPPG